MKKPTPQQYALALKLALEETPESQRGEHITRFCKLLSESASLHRADDIIHALETLYDTEEGRVRTEVISATTLSTEEKDLIAQYVKEKSKAHTIVLKEKKDPSLIAGAIISYRNRRVDGSVKHTLQRLKTTLTT